MKWFLLVLSAFVAFFVFQLSPSAAPETAAAVTAGKSADPVNDAVTAFRQQTREMFNYSKFDELEAHMADLRKKDEAFGNGARKTMEFYFAFRIRPEDGESRWKQHKDIYLSWIAAKPKSSAARIAYIDFLYVYAWGARGEGPLRGIPQASRDLWVERLKLAREHLIASESFPDRDVRWWTMWIAIHKCIGAAPADFDRITEEAHALFPKAPSPDIGRAQSLLPEWQGKEGGWEAWAEKCAERKDGLGLEIYARIVHDMRSRYKNVFNDSKASWPKTKEGYALMLQRYPDHLTYLEQLARLAALARDRGAAADAFRKLGAVEVEGVWPSTALRAEARKWAGVSP